MAALHQIHNPVQAVIWWGKFYSASDGFEGRIDCKYLLAFPVKTLGGSCENWIKVSCFGVLIKHVTKKEGWGVIRI